MPPAHLSAALIALAVWATAGLAGDARAHVPAPTEPARATSGHHHSRPAPAASPDANHGSNILPANADWRQSAAEWLAEVREFIVVGHSRAPALVIALSAILVLPAVALLSYLVHTARRRKDERAAIRAARLRAESMERASDRDLPADGTPALWTHGAWLRLEGGRAETLPLAGPMIRIGRHEDNDIRLPDISVHRYHAVIERTHEEAFVITDLSGEEGNGMRVNGERQERVKLSDGDLIELGRTRLRFESAPV